VFLSVVEKLHLGSRLHVPEVLVKGIQLLIVDGHVMNINVQVIQSIYNLLLRAL